ncbi:50S ribosomal protein L4 [bacterium]|nr:50S ribosomal protein L4 [bacterium]
MKATIYNQTGKEVGNLNLPESIFGVKWNADLVHQVITSEQSNLRSPIAHAKGRSEVRGGGIKPWRQKGTGRARHGSIRSPLWVGGGVTHGPSKEKNYEKKINKKMKTKALYVVLSEKFKNNEILFVDSLTLPDSKTKSAAGVLKSLASIERFGGIVSKKKNAALIAFDVKNRKNEKSFANISNILVIEFRNLTPHSALLYKFLIIENPEAGVKFLSAKMAGKKNKQKK